MAWYDYDEDEFGAMRAPGGFASGGVAIRAPTMTPSLSGGGLPGMSSLPGTSPGGGGGFRPGPGGGMGMRGMPRGPGMSQLRGRPAGPRPRPYPRAPVPQVDIGELVAAEMFRGDDEDYGLDDEFGYDGDDEFGLTWGHTQRNLAELLPGRERRISRRKARRSKVSSAARAAADELFGYDDDDEYGDLGPAELTRFDGESRRSLRLADEIEEMMDDDPSDPRLPQLMKKRARLLERQGLVSDSYGLTEDLEPARPVSPTVLRRIHHIEKRIAALQADIVRQRRPASKEQLARLSILRDRLGAIKGRLERYGACGYGYCASEVDRVGELVAEEEYGHQAYEQHPSFSHPVPVQATTLQQVGSSAKTGAGLVLGAGVALLAISLLKGAFK